MTPHKQLIRHDLEAGQVGDCWRTCVACLLDRQPDHVPHFLVDCWNDGVLGDKRLRAWLSTQGFGLATVAFAGELEDVLLSMKNLNPGIFYMLGGKSRLGCGHSVIGFEDSIAWDPSPTENGIVGPMDDGYYWVSFLVPASQLRSIVVEAEVALWLASLAVKPSACPHDVPHQYACDVCDRPAEPITDRAQIEAAFEADDAASIETSEDQAQPYPR